MTAAYEWTDSCTDDESYVRTLKLMNPDGSEFDVAAYAFEYSVQGCGADILLDEADGISVDAPTATLTISPGVDYRFKQGSYKHGLRKRDLTTDQVDQIADGTLTVTEGNF